MSEKTDQAKELAQQAIKSVKVCRSLVADLSGSSRKARQDAAAALSQVAKTKPEKLVDHIDAFIDALNRPEAQTRWECLDILAEMVPLASRSCDKAIPEAETALFDEDNGFVRMSATRFLCVLGATTENRSEKVWPLLDEALQCYHGNYEYQDMLIAVIGFSTGKLSASVKEGLAARVAFDANTGKGALQRRSQQILDNLK